MDQDNIYFSKSEMSFETKLTALVSNRASEHNVYMTYVCLVKDGLPPNSNLGKNELSTDVEEENDDDSTAPIQVERSKAVHELVESIKNTDNNIIKEKPPNTFPEESEASDQDDEEIKYNNPKRLKLTKMRWLSEDHHGYPDSSSPSISSARSTTSSKAEESDDDGENRSNIGDKYLTTILRLDKEHNLFGLSSIAVIGSKQSRPTKQSRKDDERPVFHQTAIVQVCKTACGTPCCIPGCRHKSNTDLPCSLRYSGCLSCVSCAPCYPCPAPLPTPPRPSCLSTCVPCCVTPPTCAMIPRSPKIHACCLPDNPQLSLACFVKGPCQESPKAPCPEPSQPPCCAKSPVCTCGLTAFVPPDPPQCCYGLKIKVNRKPDYTPAPHEVTPRCASELQKPLMARSCTHNPICQPPSAAFPYLMPCYWPCRPSAPCLDPTQCFHHPPCMPPRRPKGFVPISQECPKPGPCSSTAKHKCVNKSCLGANKEFQKGLSVWGKLEVPGGKAATIAKLETSNKSGHSPKSDTTPKSDATPKSEHSPKSDATPKSEHSPKSEQSKVEKVHIAGEPGGHRDDGKVKLDVVKKK